MKLRREWCAVLLAGTMVSNVAGSATRWQPAQAEPATAPSADGTLNVQISYSSVLGLKLTTKVTMSPVDAGTMTSFATSFSITTEDGLLTGNLAMEYLELVYGVIGVTLQCSNGTYISLNTQATCGGSTTAEKQKRILSFIALPIGGLYLTPNSTTIPYMTVVMQAWTGATQRSSAPSEEDASSNGKYVTDMGMQW